MIILIKKVVWSPLKNGSLKWDSVS